MLAELLLASALGSGEDCKATKPKGRPQLFVMIRELSGSPISGVAVTLQAHQGGWKERAVTDRTGDTVFTPPRSGNSRSNARPSRSRPACTRRLRSIRDRSSFSNQHAA